jgi:hypothetical protein
MKKTYQITMIVSYEYFVEADSFEEAQSRIIRENLNPESEDLVEWVLHDEHNGQDWLNEPVENTQ